MNYRRVFIVWLALSASPATDPGIAGASSATGSLAVGEAHLEAGRHDEAEKNFRSVLEQKPSSERAKRGLARTWAAVGLSALKEGNLFAAASYAEKAVEIAPDEPEYHLLLARVLYRQKEYYYARNVLERLLELDPGDIGGRVLLGEIYYQEGLLEEALSQWEKVPENSHQEHSLRRKIIKAGTELEVQENLRREVSRNFTLLHDDTLPRTEILRILDELERSYRRLSSELHSAPPDDIIVILYPQVDYQKVVLRSAAVGTYDGKIRIPMRGIPAEDLASELTPILRHELTHAFLWSMVERRLPLWFEEGLAVYFEGRAGREERIGPVMDHSGTFSNFKDINNALRGRSDIVVVAYNAAADAVDIFIQEKGFSTVVRILEEVAAGMRFRGALEEEAGLTEEELYDLWIATRAKD